MADFPALSSGQSLMYPVRRIHTRQTVVHRFLNDSEQRYRDRVRLEYFVLSFTGLNPSDLGTIEAFFDEMKGPLDSTWSVEVSGVTYNNCSFDSDTFAVTEPVDGLYDVELRIRQTRR